MSEFDFKQKVVDAIELVDLIDILQITPEEFFDAFEDRIYDNYNKILEYIGEDIGGPDYEDS